LEKSILLTIPDCWRYWRLDARPRPSTVNMLLLKNLNKVMPERIFEKSENFQRMKF
jgi:hypothetical protein